jgi:hypothetical protein
VAARRTATNGALDDPDPLRPSVALDAAGWLLEYAASNGKLTGQPGGADEATIRGVLLAREAATSGPLSADQAVSFWLAFDRLARLVKPVTARSIQSSRRVSLSQTKLWATLTVSGVITFSIFLFMCNATLNETWDLIDQQNGAALKLWSDVQMLRTQAAQGRGDVRADANGDRNGEADGAPSSVLVERVFDDMVEFSRKSSWLLQSASRLNYWFTPPWMRVSPKPVVFNASNRDGLDHLNVPPDIGTIADVEREAETQIKIYQNIRDYALGLWKSKSLLYTSLSTYFLPTAYALLGAFLYGFRLYSRLIRRNLFMQSAAHSARYYIAAITGLVVGLFGSLLPKDFGLSPLAIAFLFGYAVEAFFSRLDGLIDKLKGPSAETTAAIPRDVPEPAE